jgi:hypothetical protein
MSRIGEAYERLIHHSFQTTVIDVTPEGLTAFQIRYPQKTVGKLLTAVRQDGQEGGLVKRRKRDATGQAKVV